MEKRKWKRAPKLDLSSLQFAMHREDTNTALEKCNFYPDLKFKSGPKFNLKVVFNRGFLSGCSICSEEVRTGPG